MAAADAVPGGKSLLSQARPPPQRQCRDEDDLRACGNDVQNNARDRLVGDSPIPIRKTIPALARR